MDKNFLSDFIKNKKISIPVFSALLIFILINLIYFSPSFKGDLVLNQGDVMNFKGAAKEIQTYRETTGKEALWTNSMFGGMPAYQISTYYASRSLNYVNQFFQLFLPQPAGMVFLYMIGFFILMLCLDINPWIGIVASLAFAFSSYFFIIIEAGHNTKAVAIAYAPPLIGGVLLLMRRKWIIGLICTSLFMALEIYANHPQITYYMFLLLGLILLTESIAIFREKRFMDLFKSIGMIAVALIIGVLPNVSSLWTTAEYGQYTTRGPSELSLNADGSQNKDRTGLPLDYATDWSYGTGESFTLLIPNFKGGASGYLADYINEKTTAKLDPNYTETVLQNNVYFGDQPFTSGPVYAGAIVIFLALLAMLVVKNNLKWALLGGIVFSIVLAWGKNYPGPTDWFFNHFPLYNKFRAVSMILVVAELCLPLLAALALQELWQKNISDNKSGDFQKSFLKSIYISSGILLFFLLICLAAPDSVNTFYSEKESPAAYEKMAQEQLLENARKEKPGISDVQLLSEIKPMLSQYSEGYRSFLPQLKIAREDIFKSDVQRSLLFIFLAALVLFLFAKKILPAPAMLGVLAVLLIIDLWQVNRRYLNNESYKEKNEEGEFVTSPADNFILNDKSAINYRVVSSAVNTFNNSSVSYFHKSVGGYHGAKLKRFQELREFYLDRELSVATQIADAGINDSIAAIYLNRSCPILNMLNTRYIITQKNINAEPYLNPAANSNAWVVGQVQWAPNADSEIVWTGKINTKTTAVINENKFKAQLKGWENISPTPAEIKLNSYEPNYLNYTFNSEKEQLVVFSEIWYPAGWQAYIDGNPAEHVCANYILRAMMIPKGSHKIEFKFEPKSYLIGEKISMAGMGLLYLVVMGGLIWNFRKSQKSAA